MDEYKRITIDKQGKYILQDFNDRQNLTMSAGFLNTRGTGITPKNVLTESKLKNIHLKNTRDQEVKKNLFELNTHTLEYSIKNIEPLYTREPRVCNDFTGVSYIGYTFQPNLENPQKFMRYEQGKDTRHESR